MSPSYIRIESGQALEVANGELVGRASAKRYPIVAGIPILTEHPNICWT